MLTVCLLNIRSLRKHSIDIKALKSDVLALTDLDLALIKTLTLALEILFIHLHFIDKMIAMTNIQALQFVLIAMLK